MEGSSSPAPLFSPSCGERRHCGPGSSAPLVFASTGGALSPGLSGAQGSEKEAWRGSVSLEALAASGALQAGERGSSGPLLALGRPPSSCLALQVGRSLLPFAHLQASCLPFFPSSPLSNPPSPPILRTHSPWIPGNGWCNFVTKCPGSLCVAFMLLCPSARPWCPPWLGRVTENHGLPGCQLGLSSDHGASGGSPALCGGARRPEGVRLQARGAHPHTHLPSEEEGLFFFRALSLSSPGVGRSSQPAPCPSLPWPGALAQLGSPVLTVLVASAGRDGQRMCSRHLRESFDV